MSVGGRLRARANQHYVYSGRALLATDLDGWATGRGTEGFYFGNTRLLSRFEVRVDDATWRPAAVSRAGHEASFACYEADASASIPGRTLYLAVRQRVDEGLRSELELTNYARDGELRFTLDMLLDADFADSDEAEQGCRRQSAPVDRTWDDDERMLTFRTMHPGLDRAVAVKVEGAATGVDWDGCALRIPIALAARQTFAVQLAVEPQFEGRAHTAPARVFPAPATQQQTMRQRLLDEAARLETPNATVARAWETAITDLASLPLGLAEGPAAPMAGLPLYQQFFGRDSLTISWQALLAGPELLRDSLRANAAFQGTRVDDDRDEEPGKLIHQLRWGPASTLGLDALGRYYGDWATPVDFLAMLGQYWTWTGDRATCRELLPAARAVLAWIDRYGDRDGDGFLEYQTRSTRGVKHQGWKDSDDAIVAADGSLVEPPIAACEIQGYWYAGLLQAAPLFLINGDAATAASLVRQARALKRRFDGAFWVPGQASYAMGLGPGGRTADAVSSNPGHLLVTGILSRERAAATARRLLQPDMFSGWGVRTLSSDNPFYNPFSYHRGSVWPVEQGTVALGLARYGLWDELHRLAEGVFALSDLFAENRLPEAVGGLPRDERHPHPGIYPYSCEPQGWSASAIVMIVQALLGLYPVAPLRLVTVDPHLPAWLPEVTLRGIRVGRGRFDLHARRRRDGATDYRVLRREGPLRIVRQPPLSSGAGAGRRFAALIRSLAK